MKTTSKQYLLSAAAGLALLGSAASCSTENPFDFEGSGELKLKMVINSELTRAAAGEDHLAETAVIYISSPKGLIQKYEGLGTLPSSLVLKSGNYVAEAWAGDSVTASFESRFFKGRQEFEITNGVTNVVLDCKIANVAASIDPATINPEMMSDWKITVGNSRGSLEYTEENVSSRGYFMMPNGDTSLTWTIEGTDQKGEHFTKSGEIKDVERAHEYVLKVQYGNVAGSDEVGGAFITIVVDDREILVEDEIILHAGPKLVGSGFSLDSPVLSPKGKFEDLYIGTQAYGHYKNTFVTFSDASAFGVDYDFYDLENLLTTEVENNLKNAGFNWQSSYDASDGHTSGRITIGADMLNRLTDGDYSIAIELVADDNRSIKKTLNITVSEAKIVASPVAAEDVDYTSATVVCSLLDDTVTGAKVLYRQTGTAAWNEADAQVTRGINVYAVLTGLKPGTTYEYKAVCDGYENPLVQTFSTKEPFQLPNGGFEEWSTCSDLVNNTPFPGSGSVRTFWDTGNHGSMTMKKTVTNSATDIKHSGTYSLRMESQFVGIGSIGKFAAGNVFAGTYVATDGTDGVLQFGRPFEGPKPAKLRGYVHYRPGTIEYSSVTEAPKGDMDQGEIYIALTTQTLDIRTKSSNRLLFSDQMDKCVAYGNLVLNKNYGTDGGVMEMFEIPFTIQSGMENTVPTHIVIVASSSRWGDYFTGGNSIMYLDDLELIYE